MNGLVDFYWWKDLVRATDLFIGVVWVDESVWQVNSEWLLLLLDWLII